ncbi:hypothetical protein Anas_12170 [Armadillidium nasatum]|uniref:Uncharacterized protein n=1 Tax=Armadillidium nasatum TaxID=96803 RepID=A0A5N5T1K5_9CRUS|nr:hypothetical protein Anas_12170 [Armadillidium nasatum]
MCTGTNSTTFASLICVNLPTSDGKHWSIWQTKPMTKHLTKASLKEKMLISNFMKFNEKTLTFKKFLLRAEVLRLYRKVNKNLNCKWE